MLQEVCARPCKLANAYPLMFCLQNTCIHVQQLPCPTFCLALSLSGRDEMFGQSRQRSFQRAASQRVVGSYCSCVRVHFQSVFNCVSIVLSVCLLSYVSEHVCRLASNTSQYTYHSMNRRVHLFITRTRFLLVVYNRLI